MRGRRLPMSLRVVFLAVAALLLASCSDGEDANRSAPPVYHEGDDISVETGARFVIALDANPTTGYTWTAEKNPNVAFVSSRQVVKPASPPGTPGVQQLTFRATRAGSSTLELVYSRSWEPDEPPADTASFDVTVT